MKKAICQIFVVLLLLPFLFLPAAAKTLSDDITYTNNIDGQNYNAYQTKTVDSYLIKNGTGYRRIEYDYYSDDNCLIITDFDDEFNPVKEETVDLELPRFGGFFDGRDYYYVVTGQENPEENDSTEVIRITQYDRDWKPVNRSSLRGANTIIPFTAGSLRMAEAGDYLYVRTCHQMYESDDGLNHQANLTMQIYTPTMNIVNSNYLVAHNPTGYVSHSFDQFIIVDGTEVIALDQGDAYPRGALLGKYPEIAGQEIDPGRSYISELIMSYPGDTGENETGARMGGLEASSENYLTAGSYTGDGNIFSKIRNVYVTVTPKSDLDSGTDRTQTKWLTNLSQSGSVTAGTPQLVKYDDNTFAVLWTEKDTEYPYEKKGTYCQFVDGSGSPIGDVMEIEADLSDCHPIVNESSAIWYVTEDDRYSSDAPITLSFYILSKDGILTSSVLCQPVPATGIDLESEDSITLEVGKNETFQIEAQVEPINSTDTINYLSENDKVAQVSESGEVTAIGTGKTNIVLSAGEIKKTISVTVVRPAEGIKISSEKSLSLKIGDTSAIAAEVEPEDSTDELAYSSSDPSIADVNAVGVITAKGVGKTTINLKAGKIQENISVEVSGNSAEKPDNPANPDNPVTPEPSEPSDQPESQGKVPVYRLYNTVSGEHLYTSDQNESNTLSAANDWNYEGVGWNAPDSGQGVYRLYNPVLADHLYTTDSHEVSVLTTQQGWQSDNNGKPLFYSGGTVPIYRLYNTVSYRHLLTRDENEYGVLPAHNWSQEGVALYGLSDDSSNPNQPTEPSQSDQPTKPTQPETPAEPNQPSQPQQPTTVAVTGISVSPSSLTLKVGESESLTATITPSNATNKNIKWTTSDSAIAIVSSSGLVTAKGAGPATIRAITEDGNFSASCTVTVTQEPASDEPSSEKQLERIVLSPDSFELDPGDVKTIKASYYPSSAYIPDKSIWSSSDSSIVTVDKYGTIKAVAPGKATITHKRGAVEATCIVTVKNTPRIIFAQNEITIKVGETVTIPFSIEPKAEVNITGYSRSGGIEVTHTDKDITITGVEKGDNHVSLSAFLPKDNRNIESDLKVHVVE